jgi:hypothetical protein
MAGRFSLQGIAVVSLSWVAPDGTEYRDYAPMFEVWDRGAQIHMEHKVEPGLNIQVLLEDGRTFLAGSIENCVAEELFGYIVEITLRPKSVWADGLRRVYYPQCQKAAVGALNWGTNVAGAGLTNLLPEFGSDVGHWMKRHLPFHH